ncbi:MAG TPA: GTP 3',8-cyclase MoaA [Terriglobales bacterium]|nr:GTP 3',8-cyclase MoaA [Terriglobales bacterium]
MLPTPVDTASFSSTQPAARLLRISVTDRCNFRCRYCMPEGGVPKVARQDLLSLEELASLARWLVPRVGIKRIKLTGGEPLVRRGLEALIRELAILTGITDLSMTTNGSCLAKHAPALKTAGLKRVNVSLDTLNTDRFRELTRGGRLEDTLAGIAAGVAAGLVPLKLNSVLRHSSWQEDVPALLDYAAANNFELRFIELMRTGTARAWCDPEFVAASRVQLWLSSQGSFLPRFGGEDGPARSWLISWGGANLKVGWITPRSEPFCQSCDRLRLDSRGRLYRCLMDPKFFDLSEVLRGPNDGRTEEKLFLYLAGKLPPRSMDNTSAMSLIGG